MLALAMPAARAEGQDLNPIWSDTSETLNRSTEALAAGRADDAARLAVEGRLSRVHHPSPAQAAGWTLGENAAPARHASAAPESP